MPEGNGSHSPGSKKAMKWRKQMRPPTGGRRSPSKDFSIRRGSTREPLSRTGEWTFDAKRGPKQATARSGPSSACSIPSPLPSLIPLLSSPVATKIVPVNFPSLIGLGAHFPPAIISLILFFGRRLFKQSPTIFPHFSPKAFPSAKCYVPFVRDSLSFTWSPKTSKDVMTFCSIYFEIISHGEKLFHVSCASMARPSLGDGVPEKPSGPKTGPKIRPGQSRFDFSSSSKITGQMRKREYSCLVARFRRI